MASNIGTADPNPDGIIRPCAAADGIDYMSPQDAADVTLLGYSKGQKFVAVGRVAHLAALIMRVSPTLYEWLMRRKIG